MTNHVHESFKKGLYKVEGFVVDNSYIIPLVLIGGYTVLRPPENSIEAALTAGGLTLSTVIAIDKLSEKIDLMKLMKKLKLYL